MQQQQLVIQPKQELHIWEHDGHLGHVGHLGQEHFHNCEQEHVGHLGQVHLHSQLQQSKQGRDLQLQQFSQLGQHPRHGFLTQQQEHGLLHQQLHFGNEQLMHEQQFFKSQEQQLHPVQQQIHEKLKHDDPLHIHTLNGSSIS